MLRTFQQGKGEGVVNASFDLSNCSTSDQNISVDTDVLEQRTWLVDLERFRSNLAQSTFNFGPHFNRIEELRFNSTESFAKIRAWNNPELDEASQMVDSNDNLYHLHPCVLDAVFQSTVATLIGNGLKGDDFYFLPVSLDTFTLVRKPQSSHIYACTTTREWTWGR